MTNTDPDRATADASRGTAAEGLESLLEPTVELIRELLAHENDAAEASDRDPVAIGRRLDLALGERGRPIADVWASLREILRATPSTSSWRFVNQLFGGREPIAVAAEMLSAVANVSMYTFKAAGAQVLVENEILRHAAARVGFARAEGCFTPGGSLASLVALLLARDAAAPQARDEGLEPGRWSVYTSEEGHYSIPKAAGILGLGRRQVRRVATDPEGRMDPAELERLLAADRAAGLRPVLINATAGTTVRGAFDPLRELAAIARRSGAWLHVDGALGGGFVLSSSRRHLVDGVELVDSFSWNPHKMMGVPLQCSILLVARPGVLSTSLDESADYLFQAHEDELNPGHRSLQCGRRVDALKLWAAWRRLGDRGWDERIDRQLALARLAADRIAADPAFELIEPPPSINVCFSARDADAAAICERLDRQGRLKIGHGVVRGRRALRLVCVNPELGEHHLDSILDEIRSAAAELSRGERGGSPS